MRFYFEAIRCSAQALAVNKLRVAGALTKGLCDDFDVLFETGVDEMSWDDLDTPSTRWPELQEVREYRKNARDLVLDVIRTHPALDEPISAADATDSKFVVWSLGMICEHERDESASVSERFRTSRSPRWRRRDAAPP